MLRDWPRVLSDSERCLDGRMGARLPLPKGENDWFRAWLLGRSPPCDEARMADLGRVLGEPGDGDRDERENGLFRSRTLPLRVAAMSAAIALSLNEAQ